MSIANKPQCRYCYHLHFTVVPNICSRALVTLTRPSVPENAGEHCLSMWWLVYLSVKERSIFNMQQEITIIQRSKKYKIFSRPHNPSRHVYLSRFTVSGLDFVQLTGPYVQTDRCWLSQDKSPNIAPLEMLDIGVIHRHYSWVGLSTAFLPWCFQSPSSDDYF